MVTRIAHPPKKAGLGGGKRVLQYELGPIIGYGSWGKVKLGWKCKEEEEEAKAGRSCSRLSSVAVKICRKRRLTRKLRDGVERVYREYELVRGLAHPNIIRYIDLIETDFGPLEGPNPDCNAVSELDGLECGASDGTANSQPGSSERSGDSECDGSSIDTSARSVSSFPSPQIKDGKLYLVMEWLGPGRSLADWLVDSNVQSLSHEDYFQEVRTILRGVLEALAYLGEKRVAHHDVKLENVVYDAEQKRVTLIDFGCAEVCHTLASTDLDPKHAMEKAGMNVHFSQTVSGCADGYGSCAFLHEEAVGFSSFGTPAYQPPELILRESPGHPVIGHRADMWSLGVLAYQLARREAVLPFEGDSVYGVLERIANGHRKPNYAAIRSRELTDFVRRLLQRDPKQRMTAREALQHSFIIGVEADMEDRGEALWRRAFERLPFWRKFLCM
jgi:serine/threonine protein kinase